MPKEEGETLQIRSVNPATALGFKHAALDEDMTHAELFEHIFAFWSKHRKEEKEERKEKENSATERGPRGRKGWGAGAAVDGRKREQSGTSQAGRRRKKSGAVPPEKQDD